MLAFRDNVKLRTLRIHESYEMRNLEGIEHLTHLQALELPFSDIRSLSGADVSAADFERDKEGAWRLQAGMPKRPKTAPRWSIAACRASERINFDGCSNLSDARELAKLPKLRRVSLLGGVQANVAETLVDLRPDIEVLWEDPWENYLQETG